MPPQRIGQQLALARKSAKVSQQELAAAMGVRRQAVFELERGVRHLRLTEAAAAADRLQVSIAWFLQ